MILTTILIYFFDIFLNLAKTLRIVNLNSYFINFEWQAWPENTDPKKFVYEDIAIATYLILLWRLTSNDKQKYVDLGCGNGLLVYILNEEGHNGYGIDIRPRKIWKMFSEKTILKVSIK